MPLQKNNYLSNNFAYACFTILFILIGLTTLASSMNLLVLRLATINAEEKLTERLEQAEARRNAVRLEGDVISRPKTNAQDANNANKQSAIETDNISVCSCACMDNQMWGCNGGGGVGKGRTIINSKQHSSGAYAAGGARNRATASTSSIASKNNTASSSVKRVNNSGASGKNANKKRLLHLGSFLPQSFLHTDPAAAVANAAAEAKLKNKAAINKKNEIIEMTRSLNLLNKSTANEVTTTTSNCAASIHEEVNSS